MSKAKLKMTLLAVAIPMLMLTACEGRDVANVDLIDSDVERGFDGKPDLNAIVVFQT